MNRRGLIVVSSCLLWSGCALPSWRVWQAKVPADPGPTIATVEAQRRSAALIVDLSAPGLDLRHEADGVKFDPAERLEKIHAVAVPLSASLGEPLRRATVFEAPAVIAATRASVLETQAKAERWRQFANKYAGKQLEDTGINLAGPAGALGLVGVIVLCVAFPPIGYLLLRALPLLWGFFRRTTTAISGYIESHPDGAEELKTRLSRQMDAAHKTLVKRMAGR